MKGISHAVIGATLGYYLSQVNNMNPIETVAITTISSLIVDIDEKNSTINKILFPCKAEYRNQLKITVGLLSLFIPNSIVKYIGLILILSSVSSFLQLKFSPLTGVEIHEYHRTYFHNPIIGSILFMTPLYFIGLSNEQTVAFILGLIIAHYIPDSFTRYGIPLTPFTNRNIRMPFTYRSGNIVAEIASIFIIIIGISIIFSSPYFQNFSEIISIIDKFPV